MIENEEIFVPNARKASLQTDLVPLINVVFLLLIFFLVAGNALSPEDRLLSIPTARSSAIAPTNAINMRLRADRKIERDGTLLTLTEVQNLQSFFAHTFTHDPNKQVLITADAGLSAKYLLQLIQLVSHAGGQHIAIATTQADAS